MAGSGGEHRAALIGRTIGGGWVAGPLLGSIDSWEGVRERSRTFVNVRERIRTWGREPSFANARKRTRTRTVRERRLRT